MKKIGRRFIGGVYVLLMIAFIATPNRAVSQSYDKSNIALCHFSLMIDEGFGIPMDKSLLDSIYHHVTKVFLDSADINLKPVDFLKGKVGYDMAGYPLGRGKKAAKSNAAENYIKIVVNFSAAGVQSTTTSSLTDVDFVTLNTKVKVKLKVRIYNKKGKTIINESHTETSKDKITIKSTDFKLGNFTFTSYDSDKTETFQSLLNICAIKMASKLK